jgi:prepilin-type N-terminal cleavage/methylation domain-containing protein
MMFFHKVVNKKVYFTLVELLVVITILAILMSLFIPALKKTLRSSKEIVCINNLKQTGVALTFYLDDFNDSYPDRSYQWGPNGKNKYNGRTYCGTDRLQTLRSEVIGEEWKNWNVRNNIEPYFGSGEAMRDAFLCPFAKNDFIKEYGDGVRSIGNSGKINFPYRQPSTNSDPAYYYIGGYSLFFNVVKKARFGIHEPMTKLGERWKNDWQEPIGDTKSKFCNVVASDRMRYSGFGYPDANHPTIYGENTWKDMQNLLKPGGGAGWDFNNLLPTSAAYLLDDNSVYLEIFVKKGPAHIGGTNSFLIPTKFFEDP